MNPMASVSSMPIVIEFKTDSISLVEECGKIKKRSFCFGKLTCYLIDLDHFIKPKTLIPVTNDNNNNNRAYTPSVNAFSSKYIKSCGGMVGYYVIIIFLLSSCSFIGKNHPFLSGIVERHGGMDRLHQREFQNHSESPTAVYSTIANKWSDGSYNFFLQGVLHQSLAGV